VWIKPKGSVKAIHGIQTLCEAGKGAVGDRDIKKTSRSRGASGHRGGSSL